MNLRNSINWYKKDKKENVDAEFLRVLEIRFNHLQTKLDEIGSLSRELGAVFSNTPIHCLEHCHEESCDIPDHKDCGLFCEHYGE